MKSLSWTTIIVSSLVALTTAFPHSNSIFERKVGDKCYLRGREGYCVKQGGCKGISSSGDQYGGSGIECCVELICKVSTGTGYCRSVQANGCPNGTFHTPDSSYSEWPCSGGDIQCCVPSGGGTGTTSGGGGGGGAGQGGNGRTPKNTIDMLKDLEGYRGYIYKDQVGVDTIGYGHNCQTAPGTCEKLKQPISEKEAEDLMIKDLEQFEKCICNLPNSSKLNANQFGALISFAFNSGCFGTIDYFKGKMAQGDFKGICDAIPTTNTMGGIVTSRRACEAKICKENTTQLSGCKNHSGSP